MARGRRENYNSADGRFRQEQFEFLQQHEIIRDLSSYGTSCGRPFVRRPRFFKPPDRERNDMNESPQNAMKKLRLSGMSRTLDVRSSVAERIKTSQ